MQLKITLAREHKPLRSLSAENFKELLIFEANRQNMLRIFSIAVLLSLGSNLFSQTQRAESLRHNVVAITAQGQTGFGFITGERSGKLFIATAAHVVANALESDEKLEVLFFDDYNTYFGNILRNFANDDVALIEVERPANLKWEPNCLGIATQGADVSFVGREGEWYVPSGRALGTIYSTGNNQLQVDITSVTEGTSGAPLIAESGIVGLIVSTSGIQATAVDVNQLRSLLAEFDYFFQLTGAGVPVGDYTNDKEKEALYKDINAFEKAENARDISTYQVYLRDFPYGKFRDLAIKKIQDLEAEKATEQEAAIWKVALIRNDKIGYEEYLNKYPNGSYVDEAQRYLEQLHQSDPSNTSSTVRDRQGNTYSTAVLKDGKRWMTKNLNLETANSWCYAERDHNCEYYGRLYTWEAAKKVCPTLGRGWHLPSDEEWIALGEAYGGFSDKMGERGSRDRNFADAYKSIQTAYEKFSLQGENEFSLQLAGMRESRGTFKSLENYGTYWSSTAASRGAKAYGFEFEHAKKFVSRGQGQQNWGLSVRCVKD